MVRLARRGSAFVFLAGLIPALDGFSFFSICGDEMV